MPDPLRQLPRWAGDMLQPRLSAIASHLTLSESRRKLVLAYDHLEQKPSGLKYGRTGLFAKTGILKGSLLGEYYDDLLRTHTYQET